MLQKLRQIYDDAQQVLVEGNYRESQSLWSHLFGKPKDIPETAEIAVASTMIGTSGSVGKRLIWASLVALLSMKALVWAAAGLGLAGAGVIGFEYVQCRKHRKDVITEVNFAGQRVQGTRADLCRLHMAQVRIMNLANSFKPASAETTSDTVQDIIDSVAAESKRVKVLDGGPYSACKDTYDFSEPGIKLVNDERAAAAAMKQAASMMGIASAPSLKAAWAGRRMTEDELVDHLATLEEALPANVQEKLKQRRLKPAA